MVESYGTEALNFRLRNPGRIFSLGLSIDSNLILNLININEFWFI